MEQTFVTVKSMIKVWGPKAVQLSCFRVCRFLDIDLRVGSFGPSQPLERRSDCHLLSWPQSRGPNHGPRHCSGAPEIHGFPEPAEGVSVSQGGWASLATDPEGGSELAGAAAFGTAVSRSLQTLQCQKRPSDLQIQPLRSEAMEGF